MMMMIDLVQFYDVDGKAQQKVGLSEIIIGLVAVGGHLRLACGKELAAAGLDALLLGCVCVRAVKSICYLI